jgi:hexosaminidase
MVDTSRHFESITMLKQVVSSMTVAKLNVLHLHLVDSQAFPLSLTSDTTKRLAAFGAYSKQERYTTADLQSLQRYAAARGVRVVAEIDTPGRYW